MVRKLICSFIIYNIIYSESNFQDLNPNFEININDISTAYNKNFLGYTFNIKNTTLTDNNLIFLENLEGYLTYFNYLLPTTIEKSKISYKDIKKIKNEFEIEIREISFKCFDILIKIQKIIINYNEKEKHKKIKLQILKRKTINYKGVNFYLKNDILFEKNKCKIENFFISTENNLLSGKIDKIIINLNKNSIFAKNLKLKSKEEKINTQLRLKEFNLNIDTIESNNFKEKIIIKNLKLNEKTKIIYIKKIEFFIQTKDIILSEIQIKNCNLKINSKKGKIINNNILLLENSNITKNKNTIFFNKNVEMNLITNEIKIINNKK